ncbi:MAG TPA: alpha/beta hydrolase [Gaiellaceae bacterium]|nr:alpha/beta hydrolase [Gaiellaceae bacterium]
MPYAHVDDLQMYYEALGPSEGVPVVLLHGAGGTIDDPVGGWMVLAPSFADDFRVIVVEHRGHGRTNNPAGSMTFEQIADDVAELVDQLGLGSVHVAGISDGGVVALDCALRRPEMTRTVTAVGANYCVHDGIRAFAATLDPDALELASPEAAAEFARRHDRGEYAGYWKDLLRHIVANNIANPAWSEADLRRIRCPTLLIAGEDDPFATAEQMATMKRAIPGAEWLVVNHAGHPVHFEFPEIVGPRILDFLLRNS